MTPDKSTTESIDFSKVTVAPVYVHGVKITRKGQKSVISRPCCPFVHRRCYLKKSEQLLQEKPNESKTGNAKNRHQTPDDMKPRIPFSQIDNHNFCHSHHLPPPDRDLFHGSSLAVLPIGS